MTVPGKELEDEVAGRRTRDEGASLSRHAPHARTQLRLEELPPERKGGEDAEVALAQGDEGRQ